MGGEVLFNRYSVMPAEGILCFVLCAWNPAKGIKGAMGMSVKMRSGLCAAFFKTVAFVINAGSSAVCAWHGEPGARVRFARSCRLWGVVDEL